MIRQITWDSNTDYFETRAALDKSPSFFEKERGIKFTSAADGLGYFAGATFLKDEKTLFTLRQYRAPNQYTNIFLSSDHHDPEFVSETIAEILSYFGLSDTDVVWQWRGATDA